MSQVNSKGTALLLGSYGQTNLGDDILMFNFIDLLKKSGYEKIIANTASELLVPQKLASSVDLFETYNLGFVALIKLIRSADVIVYGGGTIYKELYKSTNRLPYGVILRMAIFNFIAFLFSRPIYNLNVGIGSLNTNIGKLLTKICINSSRLTIFRDEESFQFSKDILKIEINKIQLADDAIFLNDIWHDTSGVNRPEKTVGINLLSDIPDFVDRGNYIQSVTDFIKVLQSEGYKIVFIPFQHKYNANNDLDFFNKSIRPHIESGLLTVYENIELDRLVSTFRQLDTFVGMRFHSLLLSLSTATPFVAVNYDPKCERLTKDLSHEYSLQLEDISTDKLLKVFYRLNKERKQCSDTLKHQADNLYIKNKDVTKSIMSTL